MAKSVGDRVDRIFSRDVLISVFLALSAGKLVETAILIIFVTPHGQLLGWLVTFMVSMTSFIYWDKVEDDLRVSVDDEIQNVFDALDNVSLEELQ